MPSYKYRVLLENGKIGRGKITALNKAKAIEALKKETMQPVYIKRLYENKKKYRRLDYKKIERANQKMFVESIRVKREKNKKISLRDLTLEDVKIALTRIKTSDIVTFVNNLYILKKAKFNNVQALQSLYDGESNLALKDIIEDLLIGVESGERLYSIMESYPKVFPPLFVNFIKVGEESGNLDTALLYARDYMEQSNQVRKAVKKAVIPRVLQFFGIFGMMFVALIVGVPLLEDVYDMFGSQEEIPAATMIALDFCKWIANNFLYILAAIGIIFIAVFLYVNSPMGKYKWDKFKLTVPVVGPLINNITVSEFFQAMLLNLKNGMRIQESLEVSKNVTSNYYFLSAIEAGKANTLSGGSWIEPFEEKKLFKPMVREMVSIGMKTDLSEMMAKVNEYIKMEIKESLAIFTKVLPDITYIFVGIALIAFVITVMVPLTNVYMGGFIQMPQ